MNASTRSFNAIATSRASRPTPPQPTMNSAIGQSCPVTYAPAEMLSSRRRMLDAIGLALAAALAMWASVTAIGRTGARPLAFVGGVLLAVGAFVAGRRLMAWRAAAPSLVVAGAALL